MDGGSQVLSRGNQFGGGGFVSAPGRRVSNLIHFLFLLSVQPFPSAFDTNPTHPLRPTSVSSLGSQSILL